MGITCISPGLLTTVQDLGRYGYLSLGIAPSGALDGFSLALANMLVGNRPGEAGLDMTLVGGTFALTDDTAIAVAGADMGGTIDGAPLPMNRAVPAAKGSVIAFGPATSGCRAYLAFAGGLNATESMGSKSTNLKCALGGLGGKAVAAGDSIAFARARAVPRDIGKRFYPGDRATRAFGGSAAGARAVIRVVRGPQFDYFTENGIDAFFGSDYLVTPRSDRMGTALDGPVVEARGKTDIVSDGIPPGGIQIPSDGKPIVMLADRQTTGGYAKIATVIGADLCPFAQLRPGDAVSFRSVSLGEAVRERKRLSSELMRIERRFTIHG
jgi:antagonist of KipI